MNSFFKNLIYFLLPFVFFGLFETISAQEPRLPKILLDVPQDTVYISIDSSDTTLQLPDKFLIPSSEKLHIKHFKLLGNIHYKINYRKGKIRLLRVFPAPDSLRIIYRKYPFPLIDDYYHQELQAYTPPQDSAGQPQGEITARAVKPKFLEELDSYQTNLQKSGSIVRGIEIGNNQDLTLNSGLNLQLSGKITPDVELVAALTDESTPIQPEGNTQTLQEVDNVFVKITSPYLGGTLGDFNLIYGQSLFGNLQRKLQGITIDNRFKSTTQQLTYGTSRGIFFSNRFLGQEGIQGPYLLTGKNGEREIVVLAGTERIYVDGVLQVRGENNDYIIDYGLAQITFTSTKLITSENRIEVDFEYTNSFQRYGRNLVGLSSRGQNLAKRINYDIRFFREWDDTNNLLEDDAPLSEAEKEALAKAGGDPFKAAVPGWEADTLRGNYIQVDTLIISEDDTITFYFKYAGTENGDYRVRFSGVGEGNGQYTRERLGVFRFAGPGKGQYLPVRLVPLPGDKKLIDMSLGTNITRTWSIRGEFSGSDYDQNIFSPVDDQANRGGALQLTSTLHDSSVHLLGNNIGGLRLDARWTNQEATFSPLDRSLQPEYAYKWNLGTSDLSIEENSLEFFGSYQPTRFLIFQGNLGTLDKGSEFSSDRRSGQLQFLEKSFFPEAKFRLEDVKSLTNFDRSDWLRRNFVISKNIGIFTPRYNFNNEDRAVKKQSGGKITGFVFQDHRASLLTRRLLGLDWRFGYQNRIDELYDPNNPGNPLNLSTTQTYEAQAVLPQDRNLRGQLSITLRDKDYSEFFESLPADSIPNFQPDPQFQDTSWRDSQSHLANAELQYRNKSGSFNARWDYKVASELQALLEQRYFQIGNNQGNFTFDSTLNEFVPDPQGDYILVVLPSGDFQSVIRLETAVQFQYRPRASREKTGDFKAFLNNLSFLSYFKIEEQNRGGDIWDIYLLNLSKFHNVNTTLRGAYIINQDFYYNERNPEWGGLFRMRYRDNLSNQYLEADNNESRILLERLLEVRKRFFNRKLNLTLEYQNSRNKRWVASSPSRNLNILIQGITSGFNWRPSISWQFQLEVERGFDKDRNPERPLRVNYWDIKPQISYSLRGKARATTNLTFIRVEDVENPASRPIPFEMGKGKKAGNSWLWSARFEYFISNNVTINANYTGRKDANAQRVLHLGKAEVRAFF